MKKESAFKICINATKQELEKEKAQNRILTQKIGELENQIHGEIQCEPKKCYG